MGYPRLSNWLIRGLSSLGVLVGVYTKTIMYTGGQRNVARNKMWWVQSPNHCQSHSEYQLSQDDISRLSISNNNLNIRSWKFCSHRSLCCIPALGWGRTPFKLGLVQRSTTSERRSWETSQ